MTGNTGDQVRAVFLAFLMVVSVFGMTAGLAGSAAAAPTSASLSDTLVQSDDTVTVSGDHDGGDTLYVVADLGQDGQYNDADDAYVALSGDFSETGTYESDFVPGADLGLADGDTSDIYVTAGQPADGDDLTVADHELAGELTVDDSGPAFQQPTPIDTVVSDTMHDITVNVTDDVSTNDALSMLVWVDNNGDINSYEINPDSDTANGITYDAASGELTITPGEGDVPELEEGTVNVSMEAQDEAGNTNSTAWSFDVDQTPVTADFAFEGQTVDAGSTQMTNDENATVTVELSSGPAEIDDDSVGLQITDGADTRTYDNTSDAYDHETNTFSVDPENNDAVAAYGEATWTATVTQAQDTAGNTLDADDSFQFDLDTTPHQVQSVEIRGDAPSGAAPTGDYGTYNNTDARYGDQMVYVTFNETDIVAETIEVAVGLADAEVGNFTNHGSGEYSADLDLSSVSADEEEVEVNVTAAQDDVGNELTNPAADASDTSFDIDTIRAELGLSDPIPPEDDKDTLSGLVNVTAFFGDEYDVDEYVAFQFIIGETSDNPADIEQGEYPYATFATSYEDARDVDTTQFPDGQHVLNVIVEDENNNRYYAKQSFTLDNDQPITVQQEYLSGVTGLDREQPVAVNSELNLSQDVFDEYPEGTTFKVDNGSVDHPVETTEYDPDVHGDADLIAEHGGNSVSVAVDAVEIGLSLDVSDNPEGIEVLTDEQADSLEVTVESTDDHFDQRTQTFTLGDGVQMMHDGPHYVVSSDELHLRDGAYEVTATAQIGDVEEEAIDSFRHDLKNPSVFHGEVVSTTAEEDADTTTVLVAFDEPVASVDPAGISVDGTDANAVDVQELDQEGLAQVTFDREFQTGDAPLINFSAGAIQEEFSVVDRTGEHSTAPVYSIGVRLDEGTNTVSVPAVTGEVDLDQAHADGRIFGVNAIWSYDAENDEWDSWSPDATENSLTALEGGEGYVVDANSDFAFMALNVENLPEPNSPTVLTSQEVSDGWNLLGHYQLGNQTADEALDSIDENVDTYQLGYTGQSPAYVEQGDALWVHADQQDNYAPTQFGANGPEIFNVDTTDVVETQTTEMTISVQIDPDDAPVESVVVDSPGLGIHGVELSENPNAGGQGVTFDGTVAIDSSSLTGDEEIQVQATDTDRNFDVVHEPVTIDTAPEITSYSVNNPSAQDVEVSFDSDEQLDTITVEGTDDASGTTLNLVDFTETGDSENGFTYTATLSSGQDGTFGAQLNTAKDSAGADGASGQSDSVTVDTTEPQVSNVQASDDDGNGDVSDGDTVTVTADVTDATTDVDKVTADASAFDTGSVELVDDGSGADAQADDDTYTATFTVGSGAAEGDQTVTVSATDTAGNGGSQDVASNSLTVDTTEPDVTNVQITDDDSDGEVSDGDTVTVTADVTDATTDVDTVTANASAFDAGSVELVDDGSGADGTANDGTYTATFIVGAAATEGDQAVTVSATDTAGNGGSQDVASNTLTVDLTEPQLDATASSATSGSPDQVTLEFDENIAWTDESGTVIYVNDGTTTTQYTASDFAIGDVTGSTARIDFNTEAISTGDTVEVEYDGSGDLQDTAGNQVAGIDRTQITDSAS